MSFEQQIQVQFGHCDPAGIVFYPRYFEMTNSVVESFFAQTLGWSYANISAAAGNGVPTVKIATEFHAPSRVGDLLRFRLWIERVGRSSAGFHLLADCRQEARMEVRLTLCWVEAGRAAAWPAAMAARLKALQQSGNEEAKP